MVKRGRRGEGEEEQGEDDGACMKVALFLTQYLHSRSCKRSALQLLLAASSAQQDKATVILHSPHPPSIVSTLVTLFSSYSPRTPLSSPFSSFRISHSSPPISSYIHDGAHYDRLIHVAILGDVEDTIPICLDIATVMKRFVSNSVC